MIYPLVFSSADFALNNEQIDVDVDDPVSSERAFYKYLAKNIKSLSILS
jgi:hypothetical protein